MIYKWNEISMEMFKDIFDAYWRGDDWSKDKVLEIQNLSAIKDGIPDIRIYFGKGIDIYDWVEWNKSAIEIIKKMDSIMPVNILISHKKLSMCLLIDRSPKITPLGSVDVHYNLIWNMCFGANYDINLDFDIFSNQSLNLWYTKNGDLYEVHTENNTNIPDESKFIRVRSIDLKDWNDMIRSYTNTKDYNNLSIKEDIPYRLIRIVKDRL